MHGSDVTERPGPAHTPGPPFCPPKTPYNRGCRSAPSPASQTRTVPRGGGPARGGRGAGFGELRGQNGRCEVRSPHFGGISAFLGDFCPRALPLGPDTPRPGLHGDISLFIFFFPVSLYYYYYFFLIIVHFEDGNKAGVAIWGGSGLRAGSGERIPPGRGGRKEEGARRPARRCLPPPPALSAAAPPTTPVATGHPEPRAGNHIATGSALLRPHTPSSLFFFFPINNGFRRAAAPRVPSPTFLQLWRGALLFFFFVSFGLIQPQSREKTLFFFSPPYLSFSK